jgi:4-amino-4-deoxy-L-arabinose transferase-like glycosyltransferase
LAVRLGWGVAAGVVPGGVVFDDAAWYHWTAIGLTRGYGYVNPFGGRPTASWPPGYPAVLAVFYRGLGARPESAVVLNALAGAVTCWLVWRLGVALATPRTGVVAAGLLAFFPSSVFFSALVLSETVFACLFAALLLGAVRILTRPVVTWPWLVWGFAAGLAALVRAEAIALPIVPAAAMLGEPGARYAAGRVLAASILGAAIALTPWTLRNARVFDSFVPTTTSLGRTLWIGHNERADGAMSDAIQRAMEARMAEAGVAMNGPTGEIATNRLLRRDALRFAIANPLRELALVPARAYHLFRGDHVWQSWYSPGTPRLLASEQARRRLGRLGDLYYAAIGGLAVAGWWLRPRATARGWRVLGLLMVAWVAIFLLIYGDPRFHSALVPPACLLAAVALTRLGGARRDDDLGAAAAR